MNQEPKSLLAKTFEGLLEDRSLLYVPLPIGTTFYSAQKDLEVARYLSPLLSIEVIERRDRWYLVVSRRGQERARVDA